MLPGEEYQIYHLLFRVTFDGCKIIINQRNVLQAPQKLVFDST
jgi:hypothetical protein